MNTENRESAYTTLRPDILALIPKTAAAVLDVGCSNGALARSIKRHLPHCAVTGIEMDPEFFREASHYLDRTVQGDLNNLNWQSALGDSRFDCVIFADVLEHLVDPSRSLEQARRFLSPGGCIVLSLPNVRHLSSLVSIFVWGRFPRRDRGIFDRTHLRWFTIADSFALLVDCGMRIETYSKALRWGDQGGGRANRLLNRLPLSVKKFSPVREFLTYQICIRAHESH